LNEKEIEEEKQARNSIELSSLCVKKGGEEEKRQTNHTGNQTSYIPQKGIGFQIEMNRDEISQFCCTVR
jgi:hypothetical protein